MNRAVTLTQGFPMNSVFAKAVTGIIVVVVLGFAFQNCSKENFAQQTQAVSQSSTGGSTTTCSQSILYKPLRILFMVDDSDSTANTDPNKKYRSLAIQNFLASNQSNSNLTYSFGYFTGAGAFNYDSKTKVFSATASSPIISAADMTTALTTFDKLGTGTGTPYKTALQSIESIITDDASNTTASYVVVFMSDGEPTDLTSANASSVLSTSISAMSTTAKNRGVSLAVSAVYFGKESNSAAEAIIKTIAMLGGGNYVDTNTSTDLNISDTLTLPSCQAN